MALQMVEYKMPVANKAGGLQPAYNDKGEAIMVRRTKKNGEVIESQKKSYPMVEGVVQIPQAESLEDFFNLHAEPNHVVEILNLAISRRWREVTGRGGDPLAVSSEERAEEKAAVSEAKKIAKALKSMSGDKLDEIRKLLAQAGVEL